MRNKTAILLHQKGWKFRLSKSCSFQLISSEPIVTVELCSGSNLCLWKGLSSFQGNISVLILRRLYMFELLHRDRTANFQQKPATCYQQQFTKVHQPLIIFCSEIWNRLDKRHFIKGCRVAGSFEYGSTETFYELTFEYIFLGQLIHILRYLRLSRLFLRSLL